MTTAEDIPLAKRLGGLFDSRWDRHYVAAKLRSDPLYGAVLGELRGTSLPLLDVGCGLGVLSMYLRAHGCDFPVRGLDYDARKVVAAREAATKAGVAGLRFDHHDARGGLPDHSGNVAILDILQFFSHEEQANLLEKAVGRVAPGGKLVIRACLRDTSARYRVTVVGDFLAKLTFWMKAAPHHYPSAEFLVGALSRCGPVLVTPLHGRTPFNNHLVVLGPVP